MWVRRPLGHLGELPQLGAHLRGLGRGRVAGGDDRRQVLVLLLHAHVLLAHILVRALELVEQLLRLEALRSPLRLDAREPGDHVGEDELGAAREGIGVLVQLGPLGVREHQARDVQRAVVVGHCDREERRHSARFLPRCLFHTHPPGVVLSRGRPPGPGSGEVRANVTLRRCARLNPPSELARTRCSASRPSAVASTAACLLWNSIR